MPYTLKKGTRSKLLLVHALDATDMRFGKTAFDDSATGPDRAKGATRALPEMIGEKSPVRSRIHAETLESRSRSGKRVFPHRLRSLADTLPARVRLSRPHSRSPTHHPAR